ncbi:uncharacterized protein OCT59_001309 [Rhizophagus irregularis]|uniref:Kelch-like protein 17 n=1 Tax=Rhizophagus irregularis (strain DAOM 197198w) TaxID=1432141 RepID=A0A015J6L7_RHIIW|nr:hypothetical protein RirG_161740 [Rhizophagus irregularis DAOM 197198w]UZO00055.1 hypothetical protein OCT59_001309 [Rhizophagus irregularis]
MYDNKFLPKLSENFLEILNDGEFYDTTIEVGNDPYVKIFRTHMVILNYRSSYLRRILSITNVNRNNDGSLTHIKLPNISPGIFQIILRYIYGGRVSLEEYDTSDIIEILVASRELGLNELISHLQSFLIENKKNWMEQNFNLIYKTSFENDSFLELQNFCTELISKEPEKIFNSINFISLSEKFLISLIQHNNIKKNVIQVWEHVLKWGIAQNPRLPSVLSSYSKEDFITLENTLHHFIPFINFFSLTSKEYLDNVYPYKKIIPKDLRKNLFKYFIEQSSNNPEPMIIIKETSSKSIDSKIITIRHAELISKWIDKLEITDKMKNSYEFKLILRGSRDGFSPSKFHEICDNQFRTITIIKVKDSNEILGGYNPIEWKSNLAIGDMIDSFLFSFIKIEENIEDYILSRPKEEKNVIENDSFSGPVFGNRDLELYGESYMQGCCHPGDYDTLIRKTEGFFSVEEYEVFQIKKID